MALMALESAGRKTQKRSMQLEKGVAVIRAAFCLSVKDLGGHPGPLDPSSISDASHVKASKSSLASSVLMRCLSCSQNVNVLYSRSRDGYAVVINADSVSTNSLHPCFHPAFPTPPFPRPAPRVAPDGPTIPRPAAHVKHQGSSAAPPQPLGPARSGGCCIPARGAPEQPRREGAAGGAGVLRRAHSRGAGPKMPCVFPIRWPSISVQPRGRSLTWHHAMAQKWTSASFTNKRMHSMRRKPAP